MFVGHYGPSLAIRAMRPALPLWLTFVAAQFVDVAWALLVLSGIEKVRIVPGITAASPLDLYYMPYTHGLVMSLFWAVAAGVVCKVLFRWPSWSLALWLGLTVFSHWLLDLLVHRPDLPLYGDSMKVGLGLWNLPPVSLALEVIAVSGGLWLYLQRTTARNAVGRYAPVAFVVGMLVIQVATSAGPPPPSTAALAWSALGAYLTFALVAGWIDRQRTDIVGTGDVARH